MKKNKTAELYLTCIFFSFLLFFQVKFLNFNLGVLTSYVNNFNALNELAFWTQFYNPLFAEMATTNPLKYNIIANLIYFLSFLFSKSFIFTILPVFINTLSFYLSLRIYKLYGLNIYWSGLLAFLGITSISSLPIASSLISIARMDLSYIQYTNHYFDLLTSFSSSLVLLVFLFIFYLTLKEQASLTKIKQFIPAFWCASAFIHPAIFIFGYTFILIINILKEYRSYSAKIYKLDLFRFSVINLLPLLIAVPYFIMNVNFFNSEGSQIIHTFNYLLFAKAISLYFILPFSLMLISSSIFKLDPFEMIVRFWPIFLIAFLELLLRISGILGLHSIDSSTILDRISVYFLHFFYYVPFLSIIGKDFTYLPEIHKEKISFIDKLRALLIFFSRKLSIPTCIILISIVSLSSLSSFKNNFYEEIDSHTNKLMDIIKIVSIDIPNKDLSLVSIDDNMIYSYLFGTVLPFNLFFSKTKNMDQILKKDFITNIIDSGNSNSINREVGNLNIYSIDNSEIFYLDIRQRELIKWLNMTYHTPLISISSTANSPELNFFNKNYLITKNSIKTIDEMSFINKVNIDGYKLYKK